MIDNITPEDFRVGKLQNRIQELAQEKSYLELIMTMMSKLSSDAGLGNMIDSLLSNTLELIGGTNLILYYEIENTIHYVDVYGERKIIHNFEDELVKKVFDTRKPTEIENDFVETKLLTKEFTKAYTWVFPLLIGRHILGVFKMENLHIGMRGLYKELHLFFNYAAHLLNNEINNFTELKKANELLNSKNEELQKSKENLELIVEERTKELVIVNSKLKQELEEKNKREIILHESEEKFSRSFMNSPILMTLSEIADGRYIEVNDKFCKVSGFSREEVIGKTSVELGWINKDDRSGIKEKLVKEGRISEIELELTAKSGKSIHCLFQGEIVTINNKKVLLSIGVDITQRKIVERELELKEKFLATIIETAIDGFWLIDTDTMILDANEAYLKNSGYTLEEIKKFKISNVDALENMDLTSDHAKNVIFKGWDRFETVHIRKDGSLWDAEVSTKFLPSPHNKMVAFIRDISEKKKIERELKESNLRFATFMNNFPGAAFIKDKSGRLIYCNKAYAMMLNSKLEDIIGKTFNDDISEELKEQFKSENELVIDKREIISTESEYILPDNKSFWITTKFPLIMDEENILLGAISLDITRQKMNEEALRISEERFQLAMNASTDGIFDWDLETNKVYYSPAWSRMLGYEPEEIENDLSSWQKLTNEEDAKKNIDEIEELIANKTDRYSLEMKMLHKNGNWIDINARVNVLYNGNGNAYRIIGTHTDITKIKETEKLLKQKRNELQVVYDSIPIMLCIVDKDRKVLSANAYFKKFTGWPELPIALSEKACGVLGCVNALDDPRGCGYGYNCADCSLRHAINDTIKTGKTYLDIEYKSTLLINDRLLDVVMLCSTAYIRQDEQDLILLSMVDITDRKKAEEKLVISRNELKRAQEIAGLGTWILDLNNLKAEWSDEIYNIFGIAKTNEPIDFENVLTKYIHPEDYEKIKKLSYSSLQKRKFESAELRIIRPDNEVRYIWVYSDDSDFIEDSRSNKMTGILQDITESKLSELAVRESEYKFRSLFENLPAGFALHEIVLNEDGIPVDYKFLEVNSMFETFTGLKESDLIGKRVREVLPQTEQYWIDTYGKVAITGELISYQNYSKEFDKYFDVRAFSPVKGQFAVIFNDITDRIKYEEKLKMSDLIFNHSIDMLCIAGFDGYFKVLNPAWTETLGWTIDELLSKPWNDFVHPEDVEATNNVKALIVKGRNAYQIENRYICKDGTYKWLSWNSFPYEDENIMFGVARDVTESKKAKEYLKRSEELFRGIFDASPIAILLYSLEGRLINANNAALNVFGVDELKQILGLSMFDNPNITTEIRTQLSLGKKVSFESKVDFENIRKLGFYEPRKSGIHYFDWSITPLAGSGYLFQVIDVTDNKNSTIVLEENEKKFRKLFESLNKAQKLAESGSWEYDIKNNIRTWSENLYALLDIDPSLNGEELEQYFFDKIVHPQDSEKVKSALQISIKNNCDYDVEYRIVKKNGEIRFVHSMGEYECDSNGNVNKMVGWIQDITERKNAMEELIKAKEKAEEMNKVKSLFFANMSHELRTPFVGILGYANLIRYSVEDEELKEMANGILRTSRRLMDTLTKILDITKMEYEKIDVEFDKLIINKTIDEVSRQFIQTIRQKNLSFVKIMPDEEIEIVSDEKLLYAIINNLLNNAVKFTHEGEIEVTLTKAKKKNSKSIKIIIRDTGIGIPKDKQDVIWNEFRQASEGSTRDYQGTGLGLAIVKKYTELLKGTIILESDEGVGSKFTLTLPIK